VAIQRISHEPAYVLHRYDWSESSLILEVFTRHHGRIALVAKGVKRPASSFRPVLLPLQPLEIAFGGDAEIRTLKGAEWLGGHTMPAGDALLSGYYLNELLLRLLARDDPHARLFDIYAATVRLLAPESGSGAEGLQLGLRLSSCCCCASWACCPRLPSKRPRWHRWKQGPTMCWCPKAACAMPMPTTGQRWAPVPGGPCRRRSMPTALRPSGWRWWPGPARRCCSRCARSCVPSCTTIVAAKPSIPGR